MRHPRQCRIETIPVVSARCEHHDLRLESGGIIQRADINADHVRHVSRLIVERRAALAAKPLSLLCPAVCGSQIFDDIAGDPHGGTRKHYDGRMSRAGIPLAVAALTLEASNGLRFDLVADRAAGAAAGVSGHANPPIPGHGACLTTSIWAEPALSIDRACQARRRERAS